MISHTKHPHLSKIIGYSHNVHKRYMANLNSVAFHLEENSREKTIYNLAMVAFYTIRATLAWIGSSLTNTFLKPYKIAHLNSQIRNESARFDAQNSNASEVINHLIESRAVTNNWSLEDKQLALDLAKGTYHTTYFGSGLAMFEWTMSLLTRCKKDNQQIIFMARDGLGPYEMSKIIKNMRPEFADVKTHYLYLSRKVVKGDQLLLDEYLRQHLETEDGSSGNYLFVDIGFFGSMKETLEDAMQRSLPGSNSGFEFLVSTTDKVHGYAGSMKNSLQAIQSAGKNRGVYWLEDTNQGIIASPSKLMRDADGRLEADTVVKGKYKEDPFDSICLEAAQMALKDFASNCAGFTEERTDFNNDSINIETKKKFDTWLRNVQTKRFLYIDHT